jgi:hypothetical protein
MGLIAGAAVMIFPCSFGWAFDAGTARRSTPELQGNPTRNLLGPLTNDLHKALRTEIDFPVVTGDKAA